MYSSFTERLPRISTDDVLNKELTQKNKLHCVISSLILLLRWDILCIIFRNFERVSSKRTNIHKMLLVLILKVKHGRKFRNTVCFFSLLRVILKDESKQFFHNQNLEGNVFQLYPCQKHFVAYQQKKVGKKYYTLLNSKIHFPRNKNTSKQDFCYYSRKNQIKV